MSDNEIWGTDGQVSLPKAMKTTATEIVEMGGFCFTPEGIRIQMSEASQESMLRQGYGPSPTGGGQHHE